MTCRTCGKEWAGNAAACPQCGTPMAMVAPAMEIRDEPLVMYQNSATAPERVAPIHTVASPYAPQIYTTASPPITTPPIHNIHNSRRQRSLWQIGLIVAIALFIILGSLVCIFSSMLSSAFGH